MARRIAGESAPELVTELARQIAADRCNPRAARRVTTSYRARFPIPATEYRSVRYSRRLSIIEVLELANPASDLSLQPSTVMNAGARSLAGKLAIRFDAVRAAVRQDSYASISNNARDRRLALRQRALITTADRSLRMAVAAAEQYPAS